MSTRSLIPPELEGEASGDEFIRRLPDFDAQFDRLRAEAIREGHVLRYAGVVDVETGTIKADLEKCVSLFTACFLCFSHASNVLVSIVKIPGDAPVRYRAWGIRQHYHVPHGAVRGTAARRAGCGSGGGGDSDGGNERPAEVGLMVWRWLRLSGHWPVGRCPR